MTDNRWGGILQSRDTGGLSRELRSSLITRLSSVDSAGALKLLYDIRTKLQAEISAGRRIPEEIQALIENLPNISFAEDLKDSMEKFLSLGAELYKIHSSVSSVFSLAQTFFDRLVEVAFNYCFTLLESEGRVNPGIDFSILVTGELGRIESVNGSRSSFVLICTGDELDREYLNEFAMRFMAVLLGCFPTLSRNQSASTFFWYGTKEEWFDLIDESFASAESESSDKELARISEMVETVADLRVVAGDQVMGAEIVAAGRKSLSGCVKGGRLWHLAKEISSMPVAMGIFGRIRTVKNGRNKGKVDLKGKVIDPLSAAARVLSLACDCEETSFNGRIKSILDAGNIGVALADRLLIAGQEFMRERVRLELLDAHGEDGLFLDPDDLDSEATERFRSGLEDITTLQRLIHQQMVEVDQG